MNPESFLSNFRGFIISPQKIITRLTVLYADVRKWYIFCHIHKNYGMGARNLNSNCINSKQA
jgi:hypothetical protein